MALILDYSGMLGGEDPYANRWRPSAAGAVQPIGMGASGVSTGMQFNTPELRRAPMAQQSAAAPSGGGGISPMQGYNIYSQFAGPGAAEPGAASGASSAGGAGGGEGMMGGMMSNPWAWLAAAIVANETYQNHSGNRPNDFGEQIMDALSGKAFERDMRRYAGDSHNPGPMGKAVRYAGRIGNPKGAWNALTDAARWLGGLFD